uniref:Uncharacterized protein n=1 Tax=Chromera velia CCMP2878 TaxID=1169474 RepID=A0A0G4HII3_9ALVE|eukprot:Cvel_6948.t1-p1 / transcript=Cvel_6948.t1 / gene=Cvel_6948 / organism=Chromera_velia_CCMP2878 / gene_product=hypothetical protein / transcript_product=hypothetical protein / location=Cvel_scaffold352:41823-42912(-) / protein_length=318 / sequence_SO=supercontig / SO=protein_coding / is_pseudo=false
MRIFRTALGLALVGAAAAQEVFLPTETAPDTESLQQVPSEPFVPAGPVVEDFGPVAEESGKGIFRRLQSCGRCDADFQRRVSECINNSAAPTPAPRVERAPSLSCPPGIQCMASPYSSYVVETPASGVDTNALVRQRCERQERPSYNSCRSRCGATPSGPSFPSTPPRRPSPSSSSVSALMATASPQCRARFQTRVSQCINNSAAPTPAPSLPSYGGYGAGYSFRAPAQGVNTNEVVREACEQQEIGVLRQCAASPNPMSPGPSRPSGPSGPSRPSGPSSSGSSSCTQRCNQSYLPGTFGLAGCLAQCNSGGTWRPWN